MESELPTLLYLFYFALAAIALVLARRLGAQQQTIQTPVSSHSNLNASQIKS
ncbi:hypothetical protein [uncultured Ruegeria sp.]|uniref:hypothetical protein n=1 Tax=uncultured Ruegeria sp. TaxID=259304 RepID=UPI002637C3BE|nr:hypothetical protein [uncultured Ruegeria sp.]